MTTEAKIALQASRVAKAETKARAERDRLYVLLRDADDAGMPRNAQIRAAKISRGTMYRLVSQWGEE